MLETGCEDKVLALCDAPVPSKVDVLKEFIAVEINFISGFELAFALIGDTAIGDMVLASFLKLDGMLSYAVKVGDVSQDISNSLMSDFYNKYGGILEEFSA